MKHKKGEHPWGDGVQMALLLVFMAVWLIDSFVLHAERTMRGGVPWALRLGVFVLALAAAVMLFLSGRTALREKERPAKVLKDGAFRFVRHPLYLGTLLVYFGLSFATLSLPSFAVAVAAFIFYNYIASFEEKVMEEKFGEEYKKYKAGAGRWLPRF